MIGVIGIGLAHRQSIGPCAHLEVKTVADGLLSVVSTTPVADDHTVELPVALEDLVEHDIIMAIVLVFVEVVGAHDAPCASLLNGCLESRQIDLMQGTVAEDDIHLMAILLVVVQGIVLHTGSDTL